MPHGVAGWAETLQSNEFLNVSVVVVGPSFVALDWMLATFSTADFANETRPHVLSLPEKIPSLWAQERPKIEAPGRGRDQFCDESGCVHEGHFTLLARSWR
jgi:hypothetical protein